MPTLRYGIDMIAVVPDILTAGNTRRLNSGPLPIEVRVPSVNHSWHRRLQNDAASTCQRVSAIDSGSDSDSDDDEGKAPGDDLAFTQLRLRRRGRKPRRVMQSTVGV